METFGFYLPAAEAPAEPSYIPTRRNRRATYERFCAERLERRLDRVALEARLEAGRAARAALAEADARLGLGLQFSVVGAGQITAGRIAVGRIAQDRIDWSRIGHANLEKFPPIEVAWPARLVDALALGGLLVLLLFLVSALVRP